MVGALGVKMQMNETSPAKKSSRQVPQILHGVPSGLQHQCHPIMWFESLRDCSNCCGRSRLRCHKKGGSSVTEAPAKILFGTAQAA